MGVAPDFVFFVLACVEYSLGTTESKLPFFCISSHSLKIAVMISDTDFLSNKLTYPVRTLSIQRERKHLFILGCFLFCYCCIFLFVCYFIFSLLLTLILGNSQRPLHFDLPRPPISIHRDEPRLFGHAPLAFWSISILGTGFWLFSSLL